METFAKMKVISSLEKIKHKDELPDEEIKHLTALRGENINFQIYITVEEKGNLPVRVESLLFEYITLYAVKMQLWIISGLRTMTL